MNKIIQCRRCGFGGITMSKTVVLSSWHCTKCRAVNYPWAVLKMPHNVDDVVRMGGACNYSKAEMQMALMEFTPDGVHDLLMWAAPSGLQGAIKALLRTQALVRMAKREPMLHAGETEPVWFPKAEWKPSPQVKKGDAPYSDDLEPPDSDAEVPDDAPVGVASLSDDECLQRAADIVHKRGQVLFVYSGADYPAVEMRVMGEPDASPPKPTTPHIRDVLADKARKLLDSNDFAAAVDLLREAREW